MGAVLDFQLGNVKLLVTIGTAKCLDVFINRAADRMHWVSGPIVFGAESLIPISRLCGNLLIFALSIPL